MLRLGRSRVCAAIVGSVLALTARGAFADVITVKFDASITDATFKADVLYAASAWNMLMPTNPFATTITFGLANIGGPGLAGLTRYDTLDANGRVATSTVTFNTKATYFLDATPANNSEFNMQNTTLRQNNAAAPDTVISGCFGQANLDAAKDRWDLVSVAQHEIGHALGIGFNGGDPAGFKLYADAVTAGSGGGFTGFNIGNQFAGLFGSGNLPVTRIPINGSHYDGTVQGGVFNNTLMADPGFGQGMRSLITDLDILGVGTINALKRNDITLSICPEPSSLVLMSIAGLGLIGFLSHRRVHRDAA